MFVFYVDEKGNSSLQDRNLTREPWFVLGAMCVADTQRLALSKAVRNLKARYFPRLDPRRWEMKGADLRRASANIGRPPWPWSHLLPQKRQQFRSDLFGLFRQFRPILYFVGIHREKRLRRYPHNPFPPYFVAFTFLQQRAALMISNIHDRAGGAVFIVDEAQKSEKDFQQFVPVRDGFTRNLQEQPDYDLILGKPSWFRGRKRRGVVLTLDMPVEFHILELLDVAVHYVGFAIGTYGYRWSQYNNIPEFRELEPHLATHWSTGRWINAGVKLNP